MKTLEACPACNAIVGEQHRGGCDVERCAACGLQRLGCHCNSYKRLPWSGAWPGEAECEEYGFFARFIKEKGWVPCLKSDAGAQPDLNRLYSETVWVPALERHMRVEGGLLTNKPKS